MTAVSVALGVLGFLELPEEDTPPELIWHNDSRMEEWWASVKERRANPGLVDVPMDVPTTQNELAEQYK